MLKIKLELELSVRDISNMQMLLEDRIRDLKGTLEMCENGSDLMKGHGVYLQERLKEHEELLVKINMEVNRID